MFHHNNLLGAGMERMQQRYSFEKFIRTGRLVSVETLEQKFNPYHDPHDGRFTFAPGGRRGGNDGGAAKQSRSKEANAAGEHPAFRRVDLTLEEYNRQAKDIWKTMQAESASGFQSDADVDDATRRVSNAPIQTTSDVEASADLRSSVLSIAKITAGARLHGGQDAEKTVTFTRRADGQLVVASMQVPGRQGGRVTGVTKNTIAVAHVHYQGLEHKPGKADHSAVKIASIPSFVIIADTGTVWEIGRQGGEYVQREIKASGKVGQWQPFGS